jgi:hypothetical protein
MLAGVKVKVDMLFPGYGPPTNPLWGLKKSRSGSLDRDPDSSEGVSSSDQDPNQALQILSLDLRDELDLLKTELSTKPGRPVEYLGWGSQQTRSLAAQGLNPPGKAG